MIHSTRITTRSGIAQLLASRLSCGMALLACSALAAGASPPQKPASKLSTRDRQLVIAAACSSVGVSGKERVEPRVAGADAAAGPEASVLCQSHRQEAALPVAHYAICQKRAGKWNCGQNYEAVQVPVGKSTVGVVATGIATSAAVDAVTRASKMKAPPFSEPALPLFKGVCFVGVVPSPGYEGRTRYTITCDSAVLEFHRLCWKEGCRHFIVSATRQAAL